MEILNQILSDGKSDDQVLTLVQKLLLYSIAKNDISIQETCHILLDIPLYYSSWTFVSLNLNKKASRWIRSIGKTEEVFTTDLR